MSSPPVNDMAPRWPRPSEWPVWVVPLFVGLFSLVGSTGANWREIHNHGNITPLDGFGYLALVVGPVLLLARRRHPVPVLVGVSAITLTFLLRGYALGPVFLSLLVAVVASVTGGHRLVTWLVAACHYVSFFGLTALLRAFDVQAFRSWPLTVTQAVTSLAWTLVILGGAEFVRIRSERMAEARHTRAEEQRRKASEERLRIARELHDVLAHNISMINVQAGVALHLMDERPEQARTALAAIKEASKEALTEMRSVIGVLRQVDESAPRAPTAGLDRLDELVSRARSAGLRVTSSITGPRRPLPGGVDLAAFRIVQEALTNVTRHASPPADVPHGTHGAHGSHGSHGTHGTHGPPGGGAVTASIQITYGERDVVVQVENDGRAGAPQPSSPGGGSGIPGMRERASALGGEFSAGPLAGGGFRVWARLPVPTEGTDGARSTAERTDPANGGRTGVTDGRVGRKGEA